MRSHYRALPPTPRRVRLALAILALAAGVALTTPPTASQSVETVRFAVIGDFGKVLTTTRDVSNRVKSWNPDFIITVGDNNYELGQASTIDANIGQYYSDYIAPYFGAYGPGADVNRFFPSLGNHDWGDGYIDPPTVQPYTDYFTLPNNERYYDLLRGPAHLFAIDSDQFEPDGNTSASVQADWLRTQLTASTAPWKIVYFHQPPYTSGTHQAQLESRWPFREWGVTAVLTGHHHAYERLLVQNIPYVVNGLGGYGKASFTFPVPESLVRYKDDNGAMLVTATSERLTMEFITRTGVLVDTYSIDAPAEPGAPNNLTATAVPTGRIDLWWTDNAADELGFELERSTDGVDFAPVIVVGPDVTGYMDTGVSATPTRYYYRVRAARTEGPTAYSNVAVADTVPLPPDPAPTLTAVAANSSRIDLSWTDAADEQGYRVYRLVNTTFVHVGTVGQDVLTYADTGRMTSTTYQYVVRAFNAGGESASSSTASATTAPPLAAPTNLTGVGVSNSRIDLSWTDNSTGEDGFKIFRSTDGVNFGTILWAVGPNVTTYADTNRAASTTYYYRAQAYENSGGLSSFSNTTSATTAALPAAPSNLGATALSASTVKLTWTDNSTSEAGFRIYRSTDNVSFTRIASVGANVTSYSNSNGVTPGTTFYYRVTAYVSNGESGPSNTATVTTPSVPAAPTNLVATAVSSSRIDLQWVDNSTNETHFRIDRSTNGVSFSTVAWVTANVTSYANTGRASGTTYYYRVAAYNANGTSPFSNVASATTP